MAEISIIVPVYNVEKFLKRCIDSILAQTFTDFELILVDDGSPDNCGEICDEYAKSDKRVRVIHQENSGVSSTRNKGLIQATGNYIMFCDSDDFVEPNWCNDMLETMKQHNAGMALSSYYFYYQDSNQKKPLLFQCDRTLILEKNQFWNIYMQNLLNMPWNKIYRRDVIENNHIRFDTAISYNEDLLFILEYIRHMEGGFSFVNKQLYNYVQGNLNSLTKSYMPGLWEIKNRVFESLDETLSTCAIEREQIQNEYYSKYIWAILSAISSELNRQNKAGFVKKYIHLFQILHSCKARKAFQYGTFDSDVPPLYKTVIKSQCTLLVMVYHMLSAVRKDRFARKEKTNC